MILGQEFLIKIFIGYCNFSRFDEDVRDLFFSTVGLALIGPSCQRPQKF